MRRRTTGWLAAVGVAALIGVGLVVWADEHTTEPTEGMPETGEPASETPEVSQAEPASAPAEAEPEAEPVSAPAAAEPEAEPVSAPATAETGTAASERSRNTDPEVDDAELAALVDGNTAFAFDLYGALRGTQGNLFFSPYSISTALAMTWAGARGNTEAQMAETLHFDLGQARLHPAFDALDLTLESRGEADDEGTYREGDPFRLHVVNATWAQQGYPFLPEFLDVLAEDYGADIKLVDFMRAAEEARVRINTWVSEQTEGKITDLIPQGALDTLTRMVLTNAIYFKASWNSPFEESATEDGTFHTLSGGDVTVPMMSNTATYGYAAGEGWTAVELPYFGQELSMVVVMPDAGEFGDFETGLSAERVGAVVGQLGRERVALKLPRFTMRSGFGLSGILRDMGMPDAFGAAADFSGMTGNRDLYISAVIHQAFVAVDETGTEAAAATAVVMRARSAAMPREPIQVVVDRPFVFLIRDRETGTVLFLGRVVDPT